MNPVAFDHSPAEAPPASFAIAAAGRYHFTVQPIRVRDFAPHLGCDVARTVAYRARCTCGWDSVSCPTFADARTEGRVHAALKHQRS